MPRSTQTRGFITPASIQDVRDAPLTCVSFRIPDHVLVIAAVRGAIALVTNAWEWSRDRADSTDTRNDEIAQILTDIIAPSLCVGGNMTQFRNSETTGCIEYSNDCGTTWTVLNTDCLGMGTGADSGTIQDAIDDLTYWRDLYGSGGAGSIAPQLTAALQADRDTAYCVAAAALVDAICEGEITRRENIEKTVWSIIGAMIVDLIAVILIGTFALPALVAVAIAGALAGAAAAQFHILPLDDLRSPGKRRETACCIAEQLAGNPPVNIAALFAAMSPCPSWPIAIDEVYPMLNSVDMVVSFLRLAELAMPDVKNGTAVCECGAYSPPDGQIQWDNMTAIYSGLMVGAETATDHAVLNADYGGDPDGTGTVDAWVMQDNPDPECQYAYRVSGYVDVPVYIPAGAQFVFVEHRGWVSYPASAPAGANTGYFFQLIQGSTVVASAYTSPAWTDTRDAIRVTGIGMGAVPEGAYTLRCTLQRCTDAGPLIPRIRLERLRLWANRDDPEYHMVFTP